MCEVTPSLACDRPCKLMATVVDLLKEDDRSILDIHKESGIPFYWLKKFANNEFQNPSVNRVSYLYTFLTGKEIA